jgi:transposase
MRIFLDIEVRRVQCKSCERVKRELLDFLGDNPFYTKRFAYYGGRRCRQATIKDVAKELRLHWETIKTLEMQYMRAQLARAGTPGPKAIGIDEISIRKGHTYRIVVSDLIRKRPIWFGGADRKEASMALFYDWLGEKKTHGIRLVVMDMWKPFYNVTKARAPQAAIVDKTFVLVRTRPSYELLTVSSRPAAGFRLKRRRAKRDSPPAVVGRRDQVRIYSKPFVLKIAAAAGEVRNVVSDLAAADCLPPATMPAA